MPDCVGDFSISSMQAERIRFSGFAPIPRLSLFPRFQRFFCMGKYFREIQVPRFQRFPDSRGSPIPEAPIPEVSLYYERLHLCISNKFIMLHTN